MLGRKRAELKRSGRELAVAAECGYSRRRLRRWSVTTWFSSYGYSIMALIVRTTIGGPTRVLEL